MKLDKRTVVLGVAALALAAAAIAVTLLGRGGGESTQRGAVRAYIVQANTIQQQMHAPLARVLLAYRSFTDGRSADTPAKLAAAATALERLDRRLAAVPAPPEAKTLRRLLLDLVAREASITREVQRMSAFSPRFSRVLRGARAANAALAKRLAGIRVPKPHAVHGTRKQVLAAQRRYQALAGAAAAEQADAVDAYDRSMRRVAAALRALDPPPAFAAGYRAQLRALTHVATAGDRLSADLRKADRTDVAQLARAFTVASREAQTVAAQRAQAAAIRAYNARARAVTKATARVQTELLRLQRDLP